MPKVVGIDLGTTNSVIAVMEGGDPVVIPNAEGGRLTPSVVAFTKTGERLVGQLARRQAVLNSENTVASIKRFMGMTPGGAQGGGGAGPVQGRRRAQGRGAGEHPGHGQGVLAGGDLGDDSCRSSRRDAEKYLGEKITQAVITVPAYFNDSQRQATKNAGQIAGLEVLRIINEPTAASLAYGLDKKKTETILVWDLGGGTFDVSILEVGDGVFEVKATAGDTHLGGDDYDQRVVQFVADEFQREQGIDLRKDRQALQRLLEAAEKAKIELSSVVQTEINLPFITADQNGPKHLSVTLTRAKFEEITNDITERCVPAFRQALNDSKLDASKIDEVVLVGGSTRMPVIQQLVKKLTGKEPNQGVNPDEVVAVGAAIQAAVLTGEVKDVVLLDVTPLTLGVETLGQVVDGVIERNTTIPTRKTKVYSTAEDGQTAVDVHVLQGERPMARDNMTLGRFRLEGIPPAPRGVPQIEVTFDIDANGILNVSGQGPRHGQGAAGHHHRLHPPGQGAGGAHGAGGRAARRGGPPAPRRDRGPQPRRQPGLRHREGAQGLRREGGGRGAGEDRDLPERPQGGPQGAGHRPDPHPDPGAGAGQLPHGRGHVRRHRAGRGREQRGRRRARRRTRAAPPRARARAPAPPAGAKATTWWTPSSGPRMTRSRRFGGAMEERMATPTVPGTGRRTTPPACRRARRTAPRTVPSGEARVAQLEAELAAAQAEASANWDRFLRERAEMENYKRAHRTHLRRAVQAGAQGSSAALPERPGQPGAGPLLPERQRRARRTSRPSSPASA